uniref:Small ribosomal subunit protein uS15c n=1 Tax=Pedicularis resupinata TaxID=65043 RepID=A0A6G7SEP4_9LAMI|nr:ribosomal protein S15 [Pedicularis resupinata]QIK00106.1 ribosomal protein S15 [Pedicularis resupinata]
MTLLLLISKIHICKKRGGGGVMVTNSFISVISQKENEENRGSVEFQVFNFTTKIRKLTSHLELHKKDSSSQRGLRKILGKRQRLLVCLSKRNRERYKELIRELDIREIKTR